jgi:hypothetical protein
VDLLFPFVFRRIESINDYDHATEDARQHSLFMKLSIARVLSLSGTLYMSVPWSETLDDAQLVTLMTTQLLLCVGVPVIQALDLGGKCSRWVTAPGLAGSQDAVNHCWEAGKDFILAEHYSRVLNTCCVCVLDLIVCPAAVLVLLLGMTVTYVADYFLLARRHKAVHVFRSDMANSCVISLLVVLFVHAYASSRVVYSWPFDEAYVNDEGLVEKVNKRAPFVLWEMTNTDWHSDAQTKYLAAYRSLTWLLGLLLGGIVIVKTLKLWNLKECLRASVYGERSEIIRRGNHDITYSGVQQISSYCPSVTLREGGGREVLLLGEVSECYRFFCRLECVSV